MAATQYGTALNLTGQMTYTGLIISEDNPSVDIDFEDTDDAEGALANRTVYKRHSKRTISVIAEGSTDIAGIFPGGTITGINGVSYWVEPYDLMQSKGAKKATITLVALGIT